MRNKTPALAQATLATLLAAAAVCTPTASFAAAAKAQAADLIIYNAKVWTVDDKHPSAEAVAVRGNRIVKVGSSKDVLALKGPATRALDMEGKLVLPGFHDSHTHFGNASEFFFTVPLTDVNDVKLMAERIKRTASRVPKGLWITGGDWATSAANAANKDRKAGFEPLLPDLKTIDAASPDHPLIFRRFDHVYFANSAALKLARLSPKTPNPAGGSYGKDPVTGELNGLLYGTAGEILERQLPPMSIKQKMIGARAVQKDLNKVGITSITDMARIDDISNEQIYSFHAERSATDTRIFDALKKSGELSVRVHAMLPLETEKELVKHKVKPYSGDEWLRYGALKAYGDSGVMYKPFTGNGLPSEWSYRFPGESVFAKAVIEADKAGFDVGVHIIGDKAVNALINWYSDAIAQNPPRERRMRLIHVWHTTQEDIKRAGKLGFVADVQPFHLEREVALMGDTLDEERARSTHAWKSMIDAGVVVSLGSDLPGSYNRLHVSPYNPLENIFSAVTRTNKKGFPAGGWHPEQKLSIQEAIKAYTFNPAYTTREDKQKGSITEGKLADMIVLSKDILTVQPQEYLTTEVVYTILDGKVLDLKK